MADTDILREFLVRVNYEVNEGTRQHFTDTLGAISKGMLALGGIAELSAAGVFAAVTKMSEGVERFYFMSQRTGASVENIKAVSLAATQLGISAEQAQGAIEGLAAFMRNSPGGKSIIGSLGVDPNQDTAKVMTDLGAKLAQMPFYRARTFANMMGIDDRTLLALERGVGQFSAVYHQMVAKAGLDSGAAAEGAHTFMVNVRNLYSAFDILGQTEVQKLSRQLAPAVEQFRLALVDNFGRIEAIITYVAKGIVTFGDIFAHVVLRVAQLFNDLSAWFEHLNAGTRQTIETIATGFLALTAAWRALSLAFSLSPLGMVIVGLMGIGAAILLLYDDYKTWREGGKSLLNWDYWLKEMADARAGITKWWTGLQSWFDGVWKGLVSAFQTNTGYMRSILEVFGLLPLEVIKHWSVLKSFFTGLFGDIGAAMAWWWNNLTLPYINKLMNFMNWLGSSWLGQRVKHMVDSGANWLDAQYGYSDAGPTTPISPGEAQGNLQESLKFWLAQGLDRPHAQAIVANEEGESGGNPTDRNKSPNGEIHAGILQWSQSRRDAIFKGTGIDVWNSSHADQLKAAAWEMNGPEAAGYRAFKATPDGAQATVGFAEWVERTDGGTKEYQRRLNMYAGLNSMDPNGAAPAAPPAPAVSWPSLDVPPLSASAASTALRDVAIHQTNNTTIHGASDPEKTATKIKGVMGQHNNQLLRMSKGVAQ